MAARAGATRRWATILAASPSASGLTSSCPRNPDSIIAKASNRVGQTQTEKLIFNPAGYHNNVVRPVTVTIT